ncbi:MAG: transposase [Patescibacteria group bacterium]
MKRKVQFAKNQIYHIYNRGVEKRSIFGDENDRWRFLQGLCLFNDKQATANLLWQLEKTRKEVNFRVLREYFQKKKKNQSPLVRIMADCLMPNHYHLVLEELIDNGITKFMHKLGTGYVKYFNKKYDRVGGLFQGRFQAVQVDKDIHLQYLLVYINVLNPGQLLEPKLKEEGIRDLGKIMEFAAEYPWSTHQEYLGKRESRIIDKGICGSFFRNPSEYQGFVRRILEDKKYRSIEHLLLE